jgi:hypothetical protein
VIFCLREFVCKSFIILWSGRRDSNPRPSAPKAGQTAYRILLKFVVHKCFRWKPAAAFILSSLILVDRLCFDRHKFDYTQNSQRAFLAGIRGAPRHQLSGRKTFSAAIMCASVCQLFDTPRPRSRIRKSYSALSGKAGSGQYPACSRLGWPSGRRTKGSDQGKELSYSSEIRPAST